MNSVPLPALSVARVSGPDAADFLQAQLSADIAAVAPGAAGFACYCSPRGQVLGLLLVCRRDEGFLMLAARSLLPGLVDRLRMFVLRARVEMQVEPEWAICGLPDPGDATVARSRWRAGETGLYYAVFEEGAQGSRKALDAERNVPGWKRAEFEAGICWLGPETAERFIPQMLGFDHIGAVSFSKGCYPGQEIIARARYLGRVKRKPLLLAVEGRITPQPGGHADLFRDGEWSEATVVDSVPSGEDSTWVFIVGPADPDGAGVKALRLDGADYRCATM
ncbi:MAG: hypothetical protein PVJ33_05315 [Lysobacterales bacterium]|jgi:folate-binding protein YgfZ